MSRRLKGLLGVAIAVCVAVAAAVIYFGGSMGHRRDLQALLGAGDAGRIAEAASIAAWQPSLDYKPQAYYWLRDIDQAEFDALAKGAGLAPGPVPAVMEGVWKLPEGVAVNGWDPASAVGTSALQASGTVGSAAVWLRWSAGRMHAVALSQLE